MKAIPKQKLGPFWGAFIGLSQSPVRDNRCQVVNISVRGTLVLPQFAPVSINMPWPLSHFPHAHLGGACQRVNSLLSRSHVSLFHFCLTTLFLALKFLLLKNKTDPIKKKSWKKKTLHGKSPGNQDPASAGGFSRLNAKNHKTWSFI